MALREEVVPTYKEEEGGKKEEEIRKKKVRWIGKRQGLH